MTENAAQTAETDIAGQVRRMAIAAKDACIAAASLSGDVKNRALMEIAETIRTRRADLQSANEIDLDRVDEFGLSEAMVNRLRLTDKVIESMAAGVEQIARQIDPVGSVISGHVQPNGLRIEKRAVPLGVVGFIYESRPNVTSDAAALCLKSGNCVILRGGKEAIHSNRAIAALISEAAESAGAPAAMIQLVDTIDRKAVEAMLHLDRYIDVVIPRGGESLIRFVVENSTIPVIKHYAGNCHVYVHADVGDLKQAVEIVHNAKCQRPAVCNAMETLLVNAAIAEEFLPSACDALSAAGVELRGCARSRAIVAAIQEASEDDWRTEFLDLILAVRVVEGLDDAVRHINEYGSHHTDAILTESLDAADRFVSGVDSASVMVNASTRWSDGFEYGLGAEIGISTDKLHARGPMGAADLTTYKWVVTGRGHVRT
jgi:glutamate-5-semialdehyde dehydrogenase